MPSPTLTDDEVSRSARRLAAAIEPVAGQVYFSPEAHAEYEALGFAASPATTPEGVHLPDGPAYFTSRGSALGQVPGELVAAAFAVFNPAIVVPLVAYGWSLTDAPTIAAARRRGGVAQLARILGPAPAGVDQVAELLALAATPLRPEGRPLFAGVLSLEIPDDPLARVFHLTDLLREYRGDSHTAAWITAGFDATEIGLLTELYWGLPMGSYVRTRAWSSDELDEAKVRLGARGLLDGESFTDEGRAAREAVERHTDRQCAPIIEALGDRFDDLLAVLEPWGTEVRAASGYLPTGPHDLAAARP
jgi:hypothetical protein